MAEEREGEIPEIEIEGYEILERLGRGSMGVVYRARQISLDRIVAIKILSPKLAENPGYVEWFLKEARIIGSLNHINIITAIDFGETGGSRYLVMEYADGPTLAELVERGGAMDEARALEIAIQMARALDYAHRNRLVHRDVKPHNMIMAPGGVAKLCDLGLARSRTQDGSTTGGQVCGTPDFMSPEQARGLSEVNIRSDIYSLGITLFYMLVGEVPFKGETPSHTMAMHLTRRIDDPRERRPDLAESTSRVLEKMTAKEPQYRYSDPSALIADLQQALSNLESKGAPPAARRPACYPSGSVRSTRRGARKGRRR